MHWWFIGLGIPLRDLEQNSYPLYTHGNSGYYQKNIMSEGLHCFRMTKEMSGKHQDSMSWINKLKSEDIHLKVQRQGASSIQAKQEQRQLREIIYVYIYLRMRTKEIYQLFKFGSRIINLPSKKCSLVIFDKVYKQRRELL